MHSAQKGVAEPALAGVAPLAEAPELAVVQPLHHRSRVGVVHAEHFELAGAACRDLLAVGEAHPLALRRLGADTTEVKKLMQNDFQDTMAKYQIIKSSRLYRQEIAIAALNTPTTRVLAAQAADELLNISGITASFVLYPDGDQVIISARSIGSANVQMILEPLGGGGNTATAGAQMKDITVKDALDELVASIDKFYEE